MTGNKNRKIEGAARHPAADRLDITGSRWTAPADLPDLISKGDFTQIFLAHTECEILRPRPDQHNYELLV
ncbi:hypothetical protein [Streptomyces chrestomyceticus]|uniref:hypothetical protein n=1 Tax=Streptomyces chrestomyceticus TaxID=68185 RepID=UPI0019CF81FD|nr:hypothetical protein [Streptomyces chrestomyceticus]